MVCKIAIDGPAASGKSSAAELVAKKLDFERLDSGMLYRAITFLLEEFDDEYDLKDEKVKSFVNSLTIEQKDRQIFYCGRNITEYLRTAEIDQKVGVVAKELYVRQKVHQLQDLIMSQSKKGLIVDGRDIGTVVIPNAFLKIFITAKDQTRAARRSKQTGQKYEEVLEDIKKRDFNDINREHGPLKIADDAYLLENDDLTLDQTVDKIIKIFHTKISKSESI